MFHGGAGDRLIVMATRGAVRCWTVGARRGADGVVRQGPGPVLVVRPNQAP